MGNLIDELKLQQQENEHNERVLSAASNLFREHGVENIKGIVKRFDDRATAHAVSCLLGQSSEDRAASRDTCIKGIREELANLTDDEVVICHAAIVSLLDTWSRAEGQNERMKSIMNTVSDAVFSALKGQDEAKADPSPSEAKAPEPESPSQEQPNRSTAHTGFAEALFGGR